MSFKSELRDLLIANVCPRVYPRVTPDVPNFPLIIYQQVGGEAYAYVEKKLPDHKHARMQLTFWAKDSEEAGDLARATEKLLIESEWPAEAYGAVTDLYEQKLKIYGERQDYGIWYPDH